MYIAMNRFIINPGHETAFENVWKNRDSKLEQVPGFQTFKLLKGPVNEENGTTLYASHTIWENRDAFIAWTKSEHFREAHRNAGDNSAMYVGHPNFEGFEVVEGA
ncbi:MAG: antibiotic biosynthesis monooxygenase [Pseudomonadota bacterium]